MVAILNTSQVEFSAAAAEVSGAAAPDSIYLNVISGMILFGNEVSKYFITFISVISFWQILVLVSSSFILGFIFRKKITKEKIIKVIKLIGTLLLLMLQQLFNLLKINYISMEIVFSLLVMNGWIVAINKVMYVNIGSLVMYMIQIYWIVSYYTYRELQSNSKYESTEKVYV